MLPLLAAATAGYLFLRGKRRNPKARRPHRRRRVKRNPATPERAAELRQALKEAKARVAAAKKAPIPTQVPSMRKAYRRSLISDAMIGVTALEQAMRYEGVDPDSKSNPLKRGYSRFTIGANIRKLVREGYSGKQAAAIAFSTARRSAARSGKKRVVRRLRPRKK